MRRKCDMPFQMLKIQMDGQIFMCSAGQPALLNAFEVDPNDIWNSPRFVALRRQLDEENYDAMCRRCPLVQDFADAQPQTDPAHEQAKTLRLVEDRVVGGDGKPARVNARVDGWIDNVERVNGRLIVTGWACDFAESVPARIVVVFVHGKAVAAAAPTGERPDVASHFGNQQLRECGFRVSLPQPPPGETVRVYAIDARGKVGALQRVGETRTAR